MGEVVYRIDGMDETRGWLSGASGVLKDPTPALKQVGEEMILRTQQRMRAGLDVHRRPFVPSSRARGGGQTLWNRGALAASANYQASRGVLDLFSSDPRARVHQEGETITPKKAKWLTIPLRARDGSHEGGGVEPVANRTGRKARHFKDTFFLRRNGRLFLMQRTGGGKGALRALFILVKSVKLPKREWLGFGREDLEMAAGTLAEHLEKGGESGGQKR